MLHAQLSTRYMSDINSVSVSESNSGWIYDMWVYKIYTVI